MFCKKCGLQLSDNVKFCTKCGAKKERGNDAAENTEILHTEVQHDATEMLSHDISADARSMTKKKNKIWLIILLCAMSIVLLVAIGFGVYFITHQSGNDEFTGILEKAGQALADEDYEKAEELFVKAIEIDSGEPNAYEGLADTYFAMNENDKAIKTLEKGYKKTKSEKLRDLLDKIQSSESLSDNAINDNSNLSENDNKDNANMAVAIPSGEKKNIYIDIRQVDNSEFPKVTFYASVTDEAGNQVESLDKSDFAVKEIDTDGNVSDATMNEVYKVMKQEKINVNLVLDASGSMDDGSKMQQAKNAASALVSKMELSGGDQAEIISFDSFVYLEQDFTAQSDLLINAVNGIQTQGQTALYDALYAGLYQTHYETGAKCVIGFTDGMENASSYSFDDVVNMAQNTGIPVYIIGIGEEYDAVALQELAQRCAGEYYSANVSDLEPVLEDIYMQIYQEQQDYYVFNYTTPNIDNKNDFRTIQLETSETSEFYGTYAKEYIPELDVNGTLVGRNKYEFFPFDQIETEVLRIRGIYNQIVDSSNNGEYQLKQIKKDVQAYYDSNGEVRRIIVKQNGDMEYTRNYYFEKGQLMFAYLEGKDSHRLYFYNEKLFRWRYATDAQKFSDAENHDKEDSEQSRYWGNYALKEGKALYKEANP